MMFRWIREQNVVDLSRIPQAVRATKGKRSERDKGPIPKETRPHWGVLKEQGVKGSMVKVFFNGIKGQRKGNARSALAAPY